MEISWGDYRTHALALRDEGYIKIVDGFSDGNVRQILSIEPKGVEEFKVLRDLMQLFFDNTSELTSYLNFAQKRIDPLDRDLYPDD